MVVAKIRTFEYEWDFGVEEYKFKSVDDMRGFIIRFNRHSFLQMELESYSLLRKEDTEPTSI